MIDVQLILHELSPTQFKRPCSDRVKITHWFQTYFFKILFS